MEARPRRTRSTFLDDDHRHDHPRKPPSAPELHLLIQSSTSHIFRNRQLSRIQSTLSIARTSRPPCYVCVHDVHNNKTLQPPLMHIYIFGSLCRGEVSIGSDIDMLAITDHIDPRLDPETFSIYSYKRLEELWKEGNPFAWHLAQDARLVFSADGKDFLKELGGPAQYCRCREDCLKFFQLFENAVSALAAPSCSLAFELSSIFLAVRNFATCFSLGIRGEKIFSRHSAKLLGDDSVPLSDMSYRLLERARILSTRGIGPMVTSQELSACLEEIRQLRTWMERLLTRIPNHG